MASVSWGQEVRKKGPRTDGCWDTVMKATNHTSEILIRTLGRTEAVTIALLPGLQLTLQAKRQSRTHTHFTSLKNHYSSVETDTAIIWKARKTSLQSARLSPCISNACTVCAVMHVCLGTGEWNCPPTSLFRP